MQASNGETKGLGGIAGRGRPNWEKVVAEDWAMRRHAPSIGQRVVVSVEEKSHAWRRLTHWLSPGMLPTCRSGDDEPNGGVACRNGAITGEFFFRHCRGLTAVEDSRTRNKTQPLSGLPKLRTRRSPYSNLP